MSVALVIQHVKRMRRIILWSVACLAVPYFSTLSHKRHDFRGKVIEHKMCVLIFCTTLVWRIFILGRIQRDIVINVHRSACKVPLLLSDFNETSNVYTNFQKKYSNIKFHKNPFSGSRVVPCGQTDMTKLIVAFRKSANFPKNKIFSTVRLLSLPAS
jgi:hypothetical protein